MVWFQRRAGLADGAVSVCEGHRKTDAPSNGRVTIGDWLVWGQFLNPNAMPTKIPLESSDQGLLISFIKIWWVLWEIIQ